ncbi:hypothetical protein LINGRAHAP2_LOCUS9374 [Linum grandiflorum]
MIYLRKWLCGFVFPIYIINIITVTCWKRWEIWEERLYGLTLVPNIRFVLNLPELWLRLTSRFQQQKEFMRTESGRWLNTKNLPSFCRHCGRFGLSSERCDWGPGPIVSAPIISKYVVIPSPANITSSGDLQVELEGPWQTAIKKRWRPKMVSSLQPNGSVMLEGLVNGKMNHFNQNSSIHGIPCLLIPLIFFHGILGGCSQVVSCLF